MEKPEPRMLRLLLESLAFGLALWPVILLICYFVAVSGWFPIGE